jgi:hypothetical protein
LKAPAKWLRQHTILFWLTLIFYVLIVVVGWQLLDRLRTFAEIPTGEDYFFLLLSMWCLLYVTAWGLDGIEARALLKSLKESRHTNWLLSLTIVVFILLGLELGIRYFVVQSDSGNRTLTSQNWFRRYWKPINSLNYRDYEINTSVDGSVQRILVTGDSFVAGHGIENIDDTFPHILRRLLGEGYSVNTAAQLGWETRQQLDALNQYPLEPDILILSHFFNDINSAIAQHDPTALERLSPPPALKWLVNNFYLPNFLYSRVLLPRPDYVDFYSSAYSDPLIWETHQLLLGEVVDWSESHHSRLIVIVWPDLPVSEHSTALTQSVIAYFVQNGVSVIDMTGPLRPMDPASVVVSSVDGHPSRLSHNLAAEQLYTVIRAQ